MLLKLTHRSIMMLLMVDLPLDQMSLVQNSSMAISHYIHHPRAS